MSDYEFVTSERLDDGSIVRIMLNRPEARNAPNRGMLVASTEDGIPDWRDAPKVQVAEKDAVGGGS